MSVSGCGCDGGWRAAAELAGGRMVVARCGGWKWVPGGVRFGREKLGAI